MICNREYVIKRMTELLIEPQKKYSQNFLTDFDTVEKTILSLDLAPGDKVIEVGPGLGALSEYIVNKGYELYAYEIDKVMIAHLKQYFNRKDLFHLIEGDFLKKDLKKDFKDEKICVVSNIPYNITTPIIEKIITTPLNIKTFSFMIQKEVTERINAKINTKEYSPLSIFLSYLGRIQQVCKVTRDKFIPSPNVDSVVLKLTFNPQRDYSLEKKLYSLLKVAFNMRRKTILNNLSSYFNGKDNALEVLKKSNISPTARPEQLSLQDYLKICENI